MNKKKVSVVIATYNQERFLPHTLESVVKQKVDFDFEVLVGDDCSSDKTAEIITEYAKKYPDIIIPIIREKNLGMAGNIKDLMMRAKGEYIAFIEGDDYWLDENKLQIQVDFLDANPDYIAVFSKCVIVDENENRLPEIEKWSGFKKEGGEYSIKDFQDYILPGQTATSVYRKIVYSEMEKKLKNAGIDISQMIDRAQVLCMLSVGKMYVMDEELSAYRRMMSADSGSWSSKNDFYNAENTLNYLSGLKTMENIATALGMPLCFDSRRNYEVNKLYDNKALFAKKDFKAIRQKLKLDYASKKDFWKEDLSRRLYKNFGKKNR